MSGARPDSVKCRVVEEITSKIRGRTTLVSCRIAVGYGMIWPRMLIVLWLLSPALGWCAEPDAQSVQKLIAKLKHPDAVVRGMSVRELAKIGPEARAAIPALIEALTDREWFDDREERISTVAGQALYHIGLEAIPALTAAIASEESLASSEALDCLARFGPRARLSLDAIAKALAVPDRYYHFDAAKALSEIDPQGLVAVPILERFASTRGRKGDDLGHGGVIVFLWRYPNHPRTLPLLFAGLKSPDARIRGSAAEALKRIPGHSDQIVPALLPLLNDRGKRAFFPQWSYCANTPLHYESVRYTATTALAAHKASGDKVVPELLKELRIPDPDGFDDSEGKAALWRIPEFSPTPPGTAARVLRFYEETVAKRLVPDKFEKFPEYAFDHELIAISCLARMPLQTAEFTAKFKTWLKSADQYQRFAGATVLASIDPDRHPEAVEQVLAVIESASDHLDYLEEDEFTDVDLMPLVAVRSLLSNPRLLERFLPLLDEWSRKRLIAWDDPLVLQNLQRLRPKAAFLAESLLDRLDSEKCVAVIRTLGPDIVPFLIANAREGLRRSQAKPEGDYWTSAPALELLPNWPTPAVTAWKVLLDYSNSPNPHYRAVAYEVLGKIRVLHGKALPELLKGLRDPRCIVRVAAAHGLGLISGRDSVVCPALIGVLSDDFADVRVAALESLVKLGVDEPGVRDAIQKLTQDPHPYVRLVALEVLSPKKP